MRNDLEYWRRLLTAVHSATEHGRIPWRDNRPDEPRLRAIFPDGMIHLALPVEGAWPPEVIVFGPWHETVGVFRPESPEDSRLVERLYQLADRSKLGEEDDILHWSIGRRLIKLQEVYRDIEKELPAGPAAVAGNGPVAGKAGR
ncbi:MAG TPA: hypothetical protein VKA46_37065 [Gemmataceae bacterium]|nr:hypothetical protein [Gemmataceae bacterium]